jgi:hypothetical protein
MWTTPQAAPTQAPTAAKAPKTPKPAVVSKAPKGRWSRLTTPGSARATALALLIAIVSFVVATQLGPPVLAVARSSPVWAPLEPLLKTGAAMYTNVYMMYARLVATASSSLAAMLARGSAAVAKMA